MNDERLHMVRNFPTPESHEYVVQNQILGHASDLCSISKEGSQTEDFFLGGGNEAEVERAKCD